MSAAEDPDSNLGALERCVREDLARVAHPSRPWLEPRSAPGGGGVYDVVIVGGGQSGLATAFGLIRSQVTNILVLDKAPRDHEGPWRSYARMHTLRSPKDFTGPDLDIPSLTYQAWHEARFGKADWEALGLISRTHWADYLLWYRDVLDLPVRNACEVTDIAPADGLIALRMRTPTGEEVVHAREVVLATGQEGMGGWTLPAPLDRLAARLRARAADPIDFAALRGKTVAVVGAGASAFDNAATALEAGAAEVLLLCRRPEPQVVQPYRWLTFRGFLRHFGDLPDEWRWRFMGAVLRMREGFPQATYDRCARHAGFRLQCGAVLLDAAEEDGRAVLTTPVGTFTADLVIAAVGVDMDFGARPELARFADNIATWGDAYAPPAAERDDRLARFPYLADDYALTEKAPGLTPWIGHVHVFSIASTMSFGASGSSINALTTAIPKLVHGLTRRLFLDDTERLWADFLAYDVPQAVLREPPSRQGGGGPDADIRARVDVVPPFSCLRSPSP